DLARRSVHPRAQDVDRAHHVAWAGIAAPPAGVDPPGGLVSRPAHRARLRRVGFVLQDHNYPGRLGLIREVPPELAMPPAAQLLVDGRASVGLVGHIAHVADDHCPGLLRGGVLHGSSTDLMIHVAQAARLLGSEPRFGALEPPPTATALSRTSLLAGKGGKA